MSAVGFESDEYRASVDLLEQRASFVVERVGARADVKTDALVQSRLEDRFGCFFQAPAHGDEQIVLEMNQRRLKTLDHIGDFAGDILGGMHAQAFPMQRGRTKQAFVRAAARGYQRNGLAAQAIGAAEQVAVREGDRIDRLDQRPAQRRLALSIQPENQAIDLAQRLGRLAGEFPAQNVQEGLFAFPQNANIELALHPIGQRRDMRSAHDNRGAMALPGLLGDRTGEAPVVGHRRNGQDVHRLRQRFFFGQGKAKIGVHSGAAGIGRQIAESQRLAGSPTFGHGRQHGGIKNDFHASRPSRREGATERELAASPPLQIGGSQAAKEKKS
ncbi:MAG: hypothetical protein BWZ10_03366 [candidate division BRC1 bacterium ADurb.BinA364]|nr:MAG: hypothetical protein BWZ10_03366 [candidate division BRC1 bacterium ADurb.BinA364]